ncbi:MAG: site-2 protease family protein [Gammaproteobacteria bacterium]|nr:site-2 protease family protein [Gammaproteobacteria bacterium]
MPEADTAATIQLLAAAVIPVLFAIALHETAHGWAARYFGDRTAEMLGRLTLNPIKHIDPVGTVAMPLILTLLGLPAFGWAKPVPVVAANMRDPKRNMIAVAAAGPASNLLMAVLWAVVFRLALGWEQPQLGARQFLLSMSQIGITFNVLLAVFNLIPIPPLDGGRVLRGLLPERYGLRLDAAERWGLILVLLLLTFGILGRVLLPVMGWLIDLIQLLVGI